MITHRICGAIGKLDVKTLSLHMPDYLSEVYYRQLRDAWPRLRTPSGQ